MKSLLICENKEQWVEFKKLFTSNFSKIELICVIDAVTAIDYLSFEGPFGMVLIDSALKSEDPSKLSQKILSIAGERPVIFFGNQAILKTRIDGDIFIKSELNYLLETPIDIPNFRDIIAKSIEWAKEEEFEKSIEEIPREELLPMRLRNFYLFDVISYDVFVELTSTKYIKVITANKKYIHNDINTYAKKGIKHLYLRKNEYLKFLEEGIDKILEILTNKQRFKTKNIIANQIKAVLLIHQYVRTIGVSEKVILLCDEVIDSTSTVLQEHKKFKNILKFFPSSTADLAEQAIMTLYLSVSILDSLTWASETSRRKLGIASLMYDSMLSNDELSKVRSLEDPKLQEFSQLEQIEFQNHPTRAAEMVRHFQGYPEVDFIVVQHHETSEGTGFPNGISNNKLTAHSCIFILATNFIVNYSNQKSEDRILMNIFREIKHLYNIGNFKDPLTALQKSIA